uniref:N-acetyltransferase domain-containing protein n=1 Tax=Angiostrongylus cantonensis TaxID=6313 RepID=A0A0K0D9D6_ANGCA
MVWWCTRQPPKAVAMCSILTANTCSSKFCKCLSILMTDYFQIGMYYVRPEWRHSGLGTLLFEKVLKIAGGANMALNGVMKMTSLYASKYGFDKMPSYKHNFVTIPTENVMIPTVVDSQCVIKVGYGPFFLKSKDLPPCDQFDIRTMVNPATGSFLARLLDENGRIIPSLGDQVGG